MTMEKRTSTKTERGMMYGTLAGATTALLLFLLTGDAWWFGMAGAGIALGLGIGTSLDRREGESPAGTR